MTMILLKNILLEDENEDDFNFEVQFAKDILSGEKKLKEFPYLKDYFNTLKAESNYIKNPVLFIGSGPLPLSPMLLTKYGYDCDGMDFNATAIAISKKILLKYKLYDDIKIFYGNAALTKNYNRYNSIILALEAGVNDEIKQTIFKHILNEAKNNVVVLVRSSTFIEEEFVNARNYVENYFKIIKKIKTFGGHSTTFVLKKNMEKIND